MRNAAQSRFAITFFILVAAIGIAAVVNIRDFPWVAGIAAYAGVSFLLLGVAYAGVGPRIFLKRADGRMSLASYVLYLPYFLLNALSFALHVGTTREPPFACAASGLYFGRRLSNRLARQLKEHGVVGACDLAAEFAEVRELRQLEYYRSIAVLDGTAPTEEQLREAVMWIKECIASGPIYVHCAVGHARTATVVIGYLLEAMPGTTVEEEVVRLKRLRSAVRLNPDQRRLLRRIESDQSSPP